MSAPDLGKWLTPTGVIVAGVALAAGVLWWNRKAIGDAAASAVEAVNPASDRNLAYRGVNAIGAAVSGDQSWSLGGAIYDATHRADGTPKTGTETTGYDFGSFGRFIDRLAGRTPAPTTGDFARMDRDSSSATAYGQEPVYDILTGLPIGGY